MASQRLKLCSNAVNQLLQLSKHVKLSQGFRNINQVRCICHSRPFHQSQTDETTVNKEKVADIQRNVEEPIREEISIQDDSQEEEYEFSIKQKILLASLDHVNEHGWTKKALEAGAASEGLPAVSHGMFPRGGAELVNFFYRHSNQELAKALAKQIEEAEKLGEEKPKTRPFIRNAIEMRLRMILPYIDTWPQAMGIQTLPQNAPESWSNLMNLSDEIWYHAGDRSTDFNWYTKRASVAAVYKASEIFMLQDGSEDKQETFAFVDRRLDDVQALGKCKGQLQNCNSTLKEGLKGLAIIGRNVMGMNSRNR